MKTQPYFKETIRTLGHWWHPGAQGVFFIMTKTKALEDTQSDYISIMCS